MHQITCLSPQAPSTSPPPADSGNSCPHLLSYQNGPGGTPLNIIYRNNITNNLDRDMELRQRNGKFKPKDSLRRDHQNTFSKKHYSTWHDRYAKVDRFFLFFSPFLFLVFNLLYWGHYQVWSTWYKTGAKWDYCGQKNKRCQVYQLIPKRCQTRWRCLVMRPNTSKLVPAMWDDCCQKGAIWGSNYVVRCKNNEL